MNTTAETIQAPVTPKLLKKVKNDLTTGRLEREWDTMVAMTRIYCRDHHKTSEGLCADCESFLNYANARLERCRFGEEKPNCAKCPVHCYQRERREQVRVIMRYAGPRMVYEHPIMSFRHWIDSFRQAPSV